MKFIHRVLHAALVLTVVLSSFAGSFPVAADDAQVQGLTYNQRVTITREADGAGITPTTVTALSGSINCTISSNRALCPIASEYTGDIDVSIITTGYETASSVSASRNVTVSNVPFQLKVIIKDDQGTAINISDLTTVTYNGVAPTYSTSNTAYWAVAASNKSLVIAKTGYVSAQLGNPGLTNVSTGPGAGQTIITLGANDVLATAVADGDSVVARGLYTALPGDITVEASAEAGASSVLDDATITIVCTGGSATALTGSPTMSAGSVGPIAPQTASSCQNGDNGTVTVTKDGFVTATQAFTYSSSDRPNTVTVSTPIKFAQKVTITREGDSSAVTPTTVTAGSSNTACTLSSNIAYCPVPVSEDGATNDVTVTATGYETDTSASSGNRASSTSSQQTINVSALKFQLKVVVTDSTGAAINIGDLGSITYSNSQAPTYSTGNTAYWTTVATNAALVITKTNYVATASTNTGLSLVSTGPTAGQTVITLNNDGVRSTAVANGDNVTARGLVAASAGDLMVTAGPEAGVASVLDGAVVTLFCTGGSSNTLTGDGSLSGGSLGPAAVKVGSSCDNGDTATVTLSKDGFVTKTTTFTFSSTARPNTAAFGNTVAFAQKVTITREGDSTAVTPSAVTAGSSNTSCTISSNVAYCPVPVAQDGTANDVTITATGYVTGRASTTNRSTGTSSQASISATNVRFTTKLTVTREAGTALTSLSGVTIQRAVNAGAFSAVTPTLTSGAVAYVADDPANGTVAYKAQKTGYVTTTSDTYTPSASTQRATTITLPYTVKLMVTLPTGEQVTDLRGVTFQKVVGSSRSNITPVATTTYAYFAEDPAQGTISFVVNPTQQISGQTYIFTSSLVTISVSAQQTPRVAVLFPRRFSLCDDQTERSTNERGTCIELTIEDITQPKEEKTLIEPPPLILERPITPLLPEIKVAEPTVVKTPAVKAPTVVQLPGRVPPTASVQSQQVFEQKTVTGDIDAFRSRVSKLAPKGVAVTTVALSQRLMKNFVDEGTPSTKKISSKDRQSIIDSYTRACGHAPRSNYGIDWEDVIRISNGYLPSSVCTASTTVAREWFERVYKRKPNTVAKADQAAIDIITYGLRPAKRDVKLEEITLKVFRGILKRPPASNLEWDVLRAMAYSGLPLPEIVSSPAPGIKKVPAKITAPKPALVVKKPVAIKKPPVVQKNTSVKKPVAAKKASTPTVPR